MMARPGRLSDLCGTDSGRRVPGGARLPHSPAGRGQETVDGGRVLTRSTDLLEREGGWGGRVAEDTGRPVALLCLCAAGLVLSSCSQLAEAYRVYDSHLDREVVAGHDDARGNYAEIRWSPRTGDGKAVAR